MNALQNREVMPDDATLRAMEKIIGSISLTGAYPKWILNQIKIWVTEARSKGGPVREADIIKEHQQLIDANLLLCAMYGWTLRIPLMVALYNISIANGMPIIETKMMNALIYRDYPTAEIQLITSTDTLCIVNARRNQKLNFAEFKTSWADITKAGYDSKPGSLYKTIPTIMIRWRTYANMARILFPDVLMGFYIEGEIMEDDKPDPNPHPLNQIEGHEDSRQMLTLPLPSLKETTYNEKYVDAQDTQVVEKPKQKPKTQPVQEENTIEDISEFDWDEPVVAMEKTFESTTMKEPS